MVCCSYLFLSQCSDLRQFLPELVGASAVIVCSIAALCWLQWPVSSRGVLAAVLLLALLFRLLLMQRVPELSDDLFRYLWDGLQLLKGINPYAAAPEVMIPVSAAEQAVHPLINHPYLVTIYPPAAQLFFAASGGTVVAFKVLCVAVDIGSCILLALLLKRQRRSYWWLTLYAWHPLVLIEGAASAHIDIAALFFVLFSLWAVTWQGARWQRLAGPVSGVSLATAVMIKLFPVVFVPFFYLLLPHTQRRRFFMAFIFSCVAYIVPFLPQLSHAIVTLQTYVNHWEFSSFSFRLLRTLFGSGQHARLILATIFGCIVVSQWWNLQQSEVTFDRLVKACGRFLLVFLLLTPTLHPWYALYLVAFIVLAPSAPALTLTWSVLLSYQVVAVEHFSGVWQESSIISFYIWFAPVLALLLTAAAFLYRKKQRR